MKTISRTPKGPKAASSRESAADFLRRMRSSGPVDDDAIAEVQAAVDENRRRWRSESAVAEIG